MNVEIDKSNLESASENLTDEKVQNYLTFYEGDDPSKDDIENGGVDLDVGSEVLLGIEVDLTSYGGANNYDGDLERFIDDGGRGNLVIRADAVSGDSGAE